MTDTPYDVLVIGSGAAGLTAALALAQTKRVLVLAKGRLDSGSTAWAQGGIAAVLDAGDTFDNHIRDTMVAGAGLNDQETVEFVIERAPASIDRLCELGVPFNREEGDLHLTRCSRRRRKIRTSRCCPGKAASTWSPGATRRITRGRAACGVPMRSTRLPVTW